MGAALPELNYFAIRSVVRWARVIPFGAALLALAALLPLAWRSDAATASIAAVIVAAVVWFAARLLVEIVAVVAETLLPR